MGDLWVNYQVARHTNNYEYFLKNKETQCNCPKIDYFVSVFRTGGKIICSWLRTFQYLIFLLSHPTAKGGNFFIMLSKGYTPGLSFCYVVLKTQLKTPFSCVVGKQGSCSWCRKRWPSCPRPRCSLRGPARHPACWALHFLAAALTRRVAFHPPAAWAHAGVEGAWVVIQLPPPPGERRGGKRQVRRQKTKGWATGCRKIGNSTRECWIWWHPDEMQN